MLRPLVLTENFPPDRGGMAQSCDRIVRSLRARGVATDVAHLGRRHHAIHVEQQEQGRLVSCQVDDDPSHAINLLWNAVTASADKPSHVIAFGGILPMLAAPSFAAWLGVPLVTLLRGNDFDTGIVSLRRGWVLRDALARSARVCVVSRDHERKVARLFPNVAVGWIPNGIDASEWSLLDHDRERARAWRATEVAPGRRVIGMFGHLKQKKGGAFFLDALRRSGLDGRFHLLIVGDAEPEMLAHLQSIESVVSWTHVPFVDRFELLPWFAACDLVVVPSFYDGMPNVVLEAGALGVPVLGSTAGGMGDLLSEGENAITFAPGDVHDCRRALHAAASLSDEALQALGGRLQATILRDFDHRAESVRYHEVLLATARRGNAAAAGFRAVYDTTGEN